MTRKAHAGLFATALMLASGMASADTYMRKGDQEIAVVIKDGKLFCTRVSDGYEMCNGMERSADGAWRGGTVKHPDMPGFMRFTGTVTFVPKELTLKGCALGMCDSETWVKKA